MVVSYTRVQKILHWVLAILVLFWLLVSGQFAEAAEGDEKGFILMFHSGGALIISVLMLWRYSKRRTNNVAPMSTLKPWEQIWSKRIHVSFYILVGAMAFSGIVQGMFFDQSVRVFGIVNITIGYNEIIRSVFSLIHNVASNLFLLLIVAHVLAALKHQFVDKQAFLKRMT